ncbi:hypothetical protein HHK36_023397 [Tetracentron sinense]|uniref:DUF4283 domain-containing protein n=1 Tax=Tetracentron sinense TaxID=13715 RepID=A0A835D7V8_TETSI|nr:hypothetical protein HHK36_023397 [Tetracentron sinense]
MSVGDGNRAWRDVARWLEWSDEVAVEVDLSSGIPKVVVDPRGVGRRIEFLRCCLLGRFVGDAPCVERFGILQLGKWAFGGYCLLLDRWVPRAGQPKQEPHKGSLWIRVFGLPLHDWCSDTLRAVGEACGGTVYVDPISVGWNMVEYARILVSGVSWQHIPNMVEVSVGGESFHARIVVEGSNPILSSGLVGSRRSVKDRLGGRVDDGVRNNRGAFARLGLAVNSEEGCEVVQDGNTAGGESKGCRGGVNEEVDMVTHREEMKSPIMGVFGGQRGEVAVGHWRGNFASQGRRNRVVSSIGNVDGKLVSSRGRFRLLRRSSSGDSLGSSSETLVKSRHRMSNSDGMGLEEQPWAQREGMSGHDKVVDQSTSSVEEDGKAWGVSRESSDEEGLWRMQVVELDGEIANLVESEGSITCTNDMGDEEEGGAKKRDYYKCGQISRGVKILAARRPILPHAHICAGGWVGGKVLEPIDGYAIAEGIPIRRVRRLPCCGIGLGWCFIQGDGDYGLKMDSPEFYEQLKLEAARFTSRFIVGFFLAAVPWYVGAFILLCVRVDYREKPGFIACTIAAILAAFAVIIGATKGTHAW